MTSYYMSIMAGHNYLSKKNSFHMDVIFVEKKMWLIFDIFPNLILRKTVKKYCLKHH